MDDINLDRADVNFDAHQFTTANQVLRKYTNALNTLRLLAEEKYHLHPFHFDNYVFFQYFQQSADGRTSNSNEPLLTSRLLKLELLKHIRNRRRQIVYWLSYFLVAVLCFFVYRQDAMRSERTAQYLVYPGMKMWRRLTLPLLQRFPRLTELYDESCLMENPFFQVELSCDPCAYVDRVVELLDHHDQVDKNGDENAMEFVPFMFKINQSNIQMNDFYSIYNKNQDIFRRDAYRVQSTSPKVTNLEELFTQFNTSDNGKMKMSTTQETHNLWRCNRMLPARLLRPLFARPSGRLPTTGIALERFISFDTPHAPTYTLPDTECANVYVQQLVGTRFIVLRPTSECRHRCRTLSMRLPQSFVLSYNWWYWKPISAPDPVADTLSVSLIGSYC